MEDGERVKRKNRNTVRKKAAGEKRRFQQAKSSPHRDLHVLLRVVGKRQCMALAHRLRGWGPLKAADFWKFRCCLATWDTTWPPTLGTAKQKSCWWEGWWTWAHFQPPKSHRPPWGSPTPQLCPPKCPSGAWTKDIFYKGHSRYFLLQV